MNIIMLNPPFLYKFSREQRSPAVTKSGTFYYPMWLAYATGVLEKEGYTVELIDAPAEKYNVEDLFERIARFKPQLIVINTSTPSIYNDVQVAEIIKNAIPNPFIVLVGPHVSALPEESLKISSAADAIARHEHDYIIRNLAQVIQRRATLEEVNGLSFRVDGTIVHNPDAPFIRELDDIPFVTEVYKKHLDISKYFYGHSLYPIVTLLSGRGCPCQCVYCVYPQTFSGRKYRYRSIENVVDELEFIADELPDVKEIMFEDDTLTVNKKRCRELSEMILRRKLKITWSANSRADVDPETMKLMHAAGCRLFCVGIESGSQQVLDSMKKSLKVERIRQFVSDAKKARILVHGCFLVGNPGETKETLETTLNFAKQLNPDTAQFFPIMVYPGTEAYDWALQNDYLTTNDYRMWLTEDGLHNCVVSRPGLTNVELVEFCDRARREFYLRPRYVLYKMKQSIFHPGEAKRTLRSFNAFKQHIFKDSLASRNAS